jgi:two-component system, chemotaxis family, chemotaxis protein CheY
MKKILVVDDDEALRRLMRLELGDTYEVIDCAEPEQGLALALEGKPDAILLDLRMPKYSGYELLQTYTSFASTRMIPVIIVSGEAGSLTKEHCKELGAAGYFDKPLDFEALRKFLQITIKPRHHTPRSEVLVRLNVPLTLKSTGIQGEKIEEVAITEAVTVSGFQCSCAAELPVNSIVDVYLNSGRGGYVGQAKVINAGWKTPFRQYGCHFTERKGRWVLQ